MSIQQQQGDEERRRAEEDALAESLRIAAYADSRRIADRDAWRGRDLTTNGADMADKQRMVVDPQIEQNAAISQRAKERK